MGSLGPLNEYFWCYLGGYQVEKRTKSPMTLVPEHQLELLL